MSNQQSGVAFKNAVVLHLHSLGFAEAVMNRPRTISEHIRTHSDIAGLPMTVAVRSGVEMKLSDALRSAQRCAEYDGKDFGIAIHNRRGYEVGGSYVAMSLDDFAHHVLPHLPQSVEVTED